MSTDNTENTAAALIPLRGQGQTVADHAVDLRGRKVHDRDGTDIGKVTDVLIDPRDREVRFLVVAHGGLFGLRAQHCLIPVDAISSVTADLVHLHQSGQHLAAAPGCDRALHDENSDYRHLSGFYGDQPFSGMGYTYSGYPYYSKTGRQSADGTDHRRD